MRGIIIAAGLGMRMRPLTEQRPKCMLPVAGRPLIDSTKDNLIAAGCREIVVVVGHMREAVRCDGAIFVENADYRNNNILHSLMSARAYLDGPVICSYSDIWVEPEIYTELMNASGDIIPAVDRDWRDYYSGRSDHPLGEAENVYVEPSGRCHVFGKGLPDTGVPGGQLNGEFLGLWRMSERGSKLMRSTFEDIDARLDRDVPFQRARHWRIAYITDMFQELTDRGHAVDAAFVERGWAELDTLQDFERLRDVAPRQRLRTIEKSTVTT